MNDSSNKYNATYNRIIKEIADNEEKIHNEGHGILILESELLKAKEDISYYKSQINNYSDESKIAELKTKIRLAEREQSFKENSLKKVKERIKNLKTKIDNDKKIADGLKKNVT